MWNTLLQFRRLNGSRIGTNLYLILAKFPAIVDAGMMDTTSISEITALLAGKDLHSIILTHCHHDHTGAASLLRAKTASRILMHEIDTNFLGDSERVGASLLGEEAEYFKVDQHLKDADVIDLGDITLKVIHTPGHTPGSICLFEPESKTLFSGDTVFPGGSIGRTDLAGGNIKEMITSLDHLRKLDVAVLAPGHMEVIDSSVNEQIMQSFRHAQSYGSDDVLSST